MNAILRKSDIEKILPHRDPFLFVDSVIELEMGKRIRASYCFKPESTVFQGHFPGDPIVPGVLLVEAMAQTAGILAYRTMGKTYREMGATLLRLDKVSFRRIVKPGEKVIFEADVIHRRDPTWKCGMRARVNDKICAKGEILATLSGGG